MTIAVDAPLITEQRTRAPLARLLRSEVRFMIRRPRTLFALALLVAAPVIAAIAIAVAGGEASGDGGDPLLSGVASLVANNGLVLPVFVLLLSQVMLLPMLGAMWSADAIAGETQTGALRGLMVAPVGRARLLGVKAFGVAMLTFISVLIVAVVGAISGVTILGGGGMLTMSGTTLPTWDSLGRIVLLIGLVTIQVWAVAAVALAISTVTEHPLVVMASTLGGIIVFTILGNIPALDWLHPFLLTDAWQSLGDVIRDPMPTDGIMNAVLRAGCYILIGCSLALGRMSTKDG